MIKEIDSNNSRELFKVNWFYIFRYDYLCSNLIVASIILLIISIIGLCFGIAFIPASRYRSGRIESDQSEARFYNLLMIVISIICIVILVLRLLRIYLIHKNGIIEKAEIIPFNNNINWIYFKYYYNDVEYKKYYKVTNMSVLNKYHFGKSYDVYRKKIVGNIPIVFHKKYPKRCIPCDVIYGIEE